MLLRLRVPLAATTVVGKIRVQRCTFYLCVCVCVCVDILQQILLEVKSSNKALKDKVTQLEKTVKDCTKQEKDEGGSLS